MKFTAGLCAVALLVGACVSDGDDEASSTTTSLPADSALSFILTAIELEPTEEIVSCIEDEGADPETSVDADAAATTEITSALLNCLTDDLAAHGARSFPPVPGLESEDVECVLQEAYGYMGELPPEEAEAAFNATVLPAEIEAVIVDRAVESCAVTEEQAGNVLVFLS